MLKYVEIVVHLMCDFSPHSVCTGVRHTKNSSGSEATEKASLPHSPLPQAILWIVAGMAVLWAHGTGTTNLGLAHGDVSQKAPVVVVAFVVVVVIVPVAVSAAVTTSALELMIVIDAVYEYDCDCHYDHDCDCAPDDDDDDDDDDAAAAAAGGGGGGYSVVMLMLMLMLLGVRI